MKSEVKWTFMVYMAGDNNLSFAGDKDLQEMRAVGSSEDVHVVVEFDNAGDRGTNRYHIQQNGVGENVESLGETDSGDPGILIDFIEWASSHYPAERYALILWNHGNGWIPLEMDRIAHEMDTVDYNAREANERSASPLGRIFFRTSLKKVFSIESIADRAICSDDGTGHSLDTIELSNVLSQAVKILDQPIDLLGMDACLMSNLEVAYQAKPYVEYIVASEENEPSDGWPYEVVVNEFVTNPDLPTPDLATKIVDAYVKSYVDIGFTGDVTQSALDLSQVDEVTTPLDNLSAALIAQMPTAKFEIGEALYATQAKFYHSTLWDIANVCKEIETITDDATIRQTANEVRATMQPQNNNFVIAESHNGSKVKDCGGTTIYLPPRILHGISRYYSELTYAQDHDWLAMLEAYHGA
jgi:hypothetical protein